MEQNTTTEVTIYNRAVETFIGGGEILVQNQLVASKAVSAGKAILSKIEGNGGKLDASLDTLCNDYLVKVAQRSKELNEARKPITQMMDEVKKMFTGVEATLDVKSVTTVPYQIHQHRNTYAKEQAELARKRAEEAERRAAKERERLSISAAVQTDLNKYFNDYLLNYKQQMQLGFNGITLENFLVKQEKLNALPTEYPHAHYAAFNASPSFRPNFHDANEVLAVAAGVTEELYTELAARFSAEIQEMKQSLIDRLPSKKAELEAAAEAERARREEAERAAEAERKRQIEIQRAEGERKKQLEEQARLEKEAEQRRQAEAEKERQRLEAERQERERNEAARLQQEAEDAKRRGEQEIEMKKAAEETMVLFDKEAELVAEEPAPETRQGFEIIVHHPAGFVQIFQFWFENEGKSLGIDKIGATKLDQMKSWCEKHAHKTGEVIDSKFLQYSPTYKAVNRKAK